MSFRDDFEKIIEPIQLNQNMPKEDFNAKSFPLIQFIRDHVPNQLYKFRGCTEHSLDAFEKDELWLSKASLFNDPHDSLFFFDKESILKAANEMFSVENVQTMLERIKQGTVSLEQIHFPNADIRQKMVETIVSFDAQQLTEMIWKTIPDFSEFLEKCFYSAKDGIREQTKMVCLSESIKSPLMWAHYADNNKGFALGYNFTNNDITICSNCPNRNCNNIISASIYPIIYSDKRFNATRYGQWLVEQLVNSRFGFPTNPCYDDQFLFIKAALYKSKDWAYENEWRIICSTANPALEGRDRYPIPKRPMAIYLGCQIPEVYRKILIHMADEKGIPKYQMCVKNYSEKYELDFDPI